MDGLRSIVVALACLALTSAASIHEDGRQKRGAPWGAAPLPAAPFAPAPLAPVAPVAPLPAVPAVPVAPVPPVAVHNSITVGVGVCPGGESLRIPCDVKRPWPQCPPQSYCYASNSADIGPYYCCPVCKDYTFCRRASHWSTYGAGWRPKAPFYPYYPPMPYNWPNVIKATAGWPSAVLPGAHYTGFALPLSEAKKLINKKKKEANSAAEE